MSEFKRLCIASTNRARFLKEYWHKMDIVITQKWENHMQENEEYKKEILKEELLILLDRLILLLTVVASK